MYFSLCVDSTDNELVCLEIIHLFVEILVRLCSLLIQTQTHEHTHPLSRNLSDTLSRKDHYFSNVRELDLVYNFHKVFVITDELVLSGELQESSKKVILDRLGILEKIE